MNTQHPLPFALWFRAVLFAAMLAVPAALRADIGYPFVTVGNPGNADDTVTAYGGSGLFFGGVSYVYDIGQYDVTLTQYTALLNAVAQADPFGLYDTSMATDLNVAGISRTGSSGSYRYAVIGDGQRPATYVSWFRAARYCNWLHNGQPTGMGEVAGSTETGAYTLTGNHGLMNKNADARYWIPTESEWYKAAYYDPSLNGGTGGYWIYATRSNATPGNVVGSGTNQANYRYYNGAQYIYAITQSSSYSSIQNYLTPVGAFTQSASYYGTYDQSGLVYEWNDAVIDTERGVRGGHWDFISDVMQSFFRSEFGPAAADSHIGFRIARISPQITALTRLGNGTVALQGRGFPNQNHTITFSPDLITPFTSLGTATAASDGTFQFTDVNAGSYSQGFYRVTFP